MSLYNQELLDILGPEVYKAHVRALELRRCECDMNAEPPETCDFCEARQTEIQLEKDKGENDEALENFWDAYDDCMGVGA